MAYAVLRPRASWPPVKGSELHILRCLFTLFAKGSQASVPPGMKQRFVKEGYGLAV